MISSTTSATSEDKLASSMVRCKAPASDSVGADNSYRYLKSHIQKSSNEK